MVNQIKIQIQSRGQMIHDKNGSRTNFYAR